jgi:hypothetical protein
MKEQDGAAHSAKQPLVGLDDACDVRRQLFGLAQQIFSLLRWHWRRREGEKGIERIGGAAQDHERRNEPVHTHPCLLHSSIMPSKKKSVQKKILTRIWGMKKKKREELKSSGDR